jgi:hypothetical protein
MFPDGGGTAGPITPAARAMAIVSFVLWAGAITAGRLMAYINLS